MRIDGASFIDYLNFKQSQGERPLPKTHGLWCKDCKHSHPYNGKGKLDIRYEKRKSGWVIMFLCPRTALHIEEMECPPTDKSSQKPWSERTVVQSKPSTD